LDVHFHNNPQHLGVFADFFVDLLRPTVNDLQDKNERKKIAQVRINENKRLRIYQFPFGLVRDAKENKGFGSQRFECVGR